jgi:7,8-didemethyl-8-hydroxy-5-deazariboflavin synthase CofG subunit
MVTPVAKHPIAFRNSAGVKLIATIRRFQNAPDHIIIIRTNIRRNGAVHGERISCMIRCVRTFAEPNPVGPITIRTGSPEQSPSCTVELADLPLASPISQELALRLIRCSADDLPGLLAAARAAKENFKPGVVTYSRKVFLPLTNLCRDYCGYCTFRRDPGDPGAHTMTPEEVLAIARAGEKLGCTEALFSLGDKPELLFPEMRETLRHLGYKSTLHYLEAMCELVLRETSLLPHPNAGLLSAEWIARLAAVSPSMGLMLETTNNSLLAAGAAHDNAPDKVPSKRLHTIEEAGKQRVPFTTGLLIGIGETLEDRVETLLAIRDLHERYGHIQEVIVQNFRAKPTIPMAHVSEPSEGDMLRTIAVARLLMPNVNIQAPPNLSAPYYEDLLDAGINDWGGISPLTPDFINPEKPWPHLEELRLRTERKGFELRQRLPVYPEFLPALASRPGLLSEKLRAACNSEGLASKRAA